MADGRATFALFRVAAGARIGFGHLRRATVLARAIGQPCALSIRGDVATSEGFDPAPASPRAALARCTPRLLIIDDLRARHARPWLVAARRAGIPCASLHDVGIGAIPSDLAVDGSLTSRRHWPARAVLAGPQFAVLGGDSRRPPRRRTRARVRHVVVSLGGGRHRALTRAIVQALQTALPRTRITVPAGFLPDEALATIASGTVHLVHAPHGLGSLLATADLAVTAGGLTLYEAVAAGVPVVAIPVVDAQRRTVRAFVRAGLAVSVTDTGTVAERGRRVARHVARLSADTPRRASMRVRGPATLDGRGAQRVARALVALTETARG